MYVDSLFLLKSVTLDSQIVSRSAGQKTNHEMMNGNVVAYEFSQRSDRYIIFLLISTDQVQTGMLHMQEIIHRQKTHVTVVPVVPETQFLQGSPLVGSYNVDEFKLLEVHRA